MSLKKMNLNLITTFFLLISLSSSAFAELYQYKDGIFFEKAIKNFDETITFENVLIYDKGKVVLPSDEMYDKICDSLVVGFKPPAIAEVSEVPNPNRPSRMKNILNLTCDGEISIYQLETY